MYIVVRVCYDYYRFQDNMFASIKKQECSLWIANQGENIPTFEYESDENKWSNEEVAVVNDHYWIQKL